METLDPWDESPKKPVFFAIQVLVLDGAGMASIIAYKDGSVEAWYKDVDVRHLPELKGAEKRIRANPLDEDTWEQVFIDLLENDEFDVNTI